MNIHRCIKKYLVLIGCLGGCLGMSLPGLSQNNSLDYYLSQALRRSPLLNDYRNQLQSARVDSEIIRAGYGPQVTGTSINTYAPIINGYGYDQAISNGGNFSTLVGVNKALISKRRLDTQYDSLRLQSLGIANTSKISEQDLKKSVTAQYISTYGDMQQMNFHRETYALLQKEERLLKELTEKNVYRQTDYLAFLVTLQQEGLQEKEFEIQFQNDFGTLNYLCGIVDMDTVALAEPSVQLQVLPEIDNSAFFQQYQIDSLKLRNSRTLIDYTYKPKASIYADGGYTSSLAYQAYKNFGTSFGFMVTVPIYDGHQRKMQYRKLDIAERTRQGYKDFFTSQYRQQIAQLSRQLKATEDLIGQIESQIKYSETLITVNGRLLQTGDAKIPDYILALKTYLNAKNLLTQNNITRFQIINQINYWNR
ncbi:MAG: TolC family protein [Bacteroidota bacterium]|nr:TolC family protein [Bacteroidota bacterium]